MNAYPAGELIEVAFFNRIAKTVARTLAPLEREATPEAVSFLTSRFSNYDCAHIDYDQFGYAFAYLYFLHNYWKALRTFAGERSFPPRRILDAGCGSGAMTIAYLALLDTRLSDRWTVEIELLDKSKEQLTLAAHLLDSVRGHLSHLNLLVYRTHTDFNQWDLQHDSADRVFFGHALNENPGEISQLLEHAFTTIRTEGMIYVLERTRDPIWPHIRQCGSQLALPVAYADTTVDTTPLYFPSRRRLSEKTLASSHLMLRCPENKRLVTLLRLYFEAWQKQSSELLEKVFAPTAEYHDKAYDVPHKGLDAIRRYWETNVIPQRDLATRILRVAYSATNAFAEWEASFRLHNELLHVKGTVILHSSDGSRVDTLHEYYRSRRQRGASNE